MLRLQRDPGGRRESGAGMRRESGSPSKFALSSPKWSASSQAEPTPTPTTAPTPTPKPKPHPHPHPKPKPKPNPNPTQADVVVVQQQAELEERRLQQASAHAAHEAALAEARGQARELSTRAGLAERRAAQLEAEVEALTEQGAQAADEAAAARQELARLGEVERRFSELAAEMGCVDEQGRLMQGRLEELTGELVQARLDEAQHLAWLRDVKEMLASGAEDGPRADHGGEPPQGPAAQAEGRRAQGAPRRPTCCRRAARRRARRPRLAAGQRAKQAAAADGGSAARLLHLRPVQPRRLGSQRVGEQLAAVGARCPSETASPRTSASCCDGT